MPLSFSRSGSKQDIAFGLCFEHGSYRDIRFIHAVGARRVISPAAAANGLEEGAQWNLFGAPGDLDDDQPAARRAGDAGHERGAVSPGPVRSPAEPVQASTGEEDRGLHGGVL